MNAQGHSYDLTTDSILTRIAQNAATRRETEGAAPKTQMREEIRMMYELIKGTRGFSGFTMMGARNIVFDNEKYMLQWQMGAGSKVDTIQFFYNESMDLYKLRFINYGGPFRMEIKNDQTIENLYVDDIRPLIEEKTGFFLSLF